MRSSIEKIISGFLIGIGICAAILLADILKTAYRIDKQKYKTIEVQNLSAKLDNELVVVKKSRLVTLSRNVTVAVQLKSKLDIAIGNATIRVKLMDTDGLFGECRGYLQKLKPGETKDLVINCSEFDSHSFPENATHLVEVLELNRHGL